MARTSARAPAFDASTSNDQPISVPGTSREALGHLATSIRYGISIMQGQQPTWPDAARPGDLVEGDPAGFWRSTVVDARDVLRNADLAQVMETPLGRTVADDLAIPVIDLYVHAWDLGAAAGIAVEIPPASSTTPTPTSTRSQAKWCAATTGHSNPRSGYPPALHRPNDSSPGPDAGRRSDRRRRSSCPASGCNFREAGTPPCPPPILSNPGLRGRLPPRRLLTAPQ
jgi:hypothetical protein